MSIKSLIMLCILFALTKATESFSLKSVIVPMSLIPNNKLPAISINEDDSVVISTTDFFRDIGGVKKCTNIQSDTPAVAVSINDTVVKIHPGKNWNGTSRITLLAITDSNTTVSYSLKLVVTPVNDPPSFESVPPDTAIFNTSDLNVNLRALVTDPDDPISNLKFRASGPGGITIQGNDSGVVITSANYKDTADILLFVSDSHGASDTARFQVFFNKAAKLGTLVPLNYDSQFQPLKDNGIAQFTMLHDTLYVDAYNSQFQKVISHKLVTEIREHDVPIEKYRHLGTYNRFPGGEFAKVVYEVQRLKESFLIRYHCGYIDHTYPVYYFFLLDSNLKRVGGFYGGMRGTTEKRMRSFDVNNEILIFNVFPDSFSVPPDTGVLFAQRFTSSLVWKSTIKFGQYKSSLSLTDLLIQKDSYYTIVEEPQCWFGCFDSQFFNKYYFRHYTFDGEILGDTTLLIRYNNGDPLYKLNMFTSLSFLPHPKGYLLLYSKEDMKTEPTVVAGMNAINLINDNTYSLYAVVLDKWLKPLSEPVTLAAGGKENSNTLYSCFNYNGLYRIDWKVSPCAPDSGKMKSIIINEELQPQLPVDSSVYFSRYGNGEPYYQQCNDTLLFGRISISYQQYGFFKNIRTLFAKQTGNNVVCKNKNKKSDQCLKISNRRITVNLNYQNNISVSIIDCLGRVVYSYTTYPNSIGPALPSHLSGLYYGVVKAGNLKIRTAHFLLMSNK